MGQILCVEVFCFNDNAKVDFENTQIMHCIFCYQYPKSKKLSKERINFLLQDKWNKFS